MPNRHALIDRDGVVFMVAEGFVDWPAQATWSVEDNDPVARGWILDGETMSFVSPYPPIDVGYVSDSDRLDDLERRVTVLDDPTPVP